MADGSQEGSAWRRNGDPGPRLHRDPARCDPGRRGQARGVLEGLRGHGRERPPAGPPTTQTASRDVFFILIHTEVSCWPLSGQPGSFAHSRFASGGFRESGVQKMPSCPPTDQPDFLRESPNLSPRLAEVEKFHRKSLDGLMAAFTARGTPAFNQAPQPTLFWTHLKAGETVHERCSGSLESDT